MHPNFYASGEALSAKEERIPLRAVVALIMVWGSLFAAGFLILP